LLRLIEDLILLKIRYNGSEVMWVKLEMKCVELKRSIGEE
jgi:hypothetical protein